MSGRNGPLVLDEETIKLIELAIEEDQARNDVTTLWTIPEGTEATGILLTREEGVLCGAALFAGVFRQLDPSLKVSFIAKDGAFLQADRAVAQVSGAARSILSGERVAINFIGHLSGIATLTSKFAEAVKGTKAIVCNTRKTTPLWRKWEKYAVRTGGGTNHRFNLAEMVLVKDNHIALAGGVRNALRSAHQANTQGLDIVVEVDTLDQLEVALSEGANRILLDNMAPPQLREAVALTSGRAVLEASGSVRLSNIREVAETGVDIISVGALTHSSRSFDFSLEISEKLDVPADNP